MSNLIGACGSGSNGCHGWVETHPTWARNEGLWLMAGDGSPDQVSTHMRWHDTKGWWALRDDGSLEWDGGEFEQVKLAPRDATTKFGRVAV